MKLDLFYYDLPEKFIAQEPLIQRDRSKLMILNRKTGEISHDIFCNISEYLKKDDVLVLNESKVTKCRLSGIKENTGAKIEVFVLRRIKGEKYLVLLKPAKKLSVLSKVNIGNYYFSVIEKLGYGKAVVEFNASLDDIINKYGKVPLPPYIKNENISEERYQTIYARVNGSAAAPTAGFHFTYKLIKELKGRGINFARLRLDIGLDTFRPIIEDEIEEHVIHNEYYSLSDSEANKISRSLQDGGRIVAVGTTSTRVLETVFSKKGKISGDRGNTELYIYPGYKFKAVDAMLTNFHLPYSTLLVMVSAFAGRENVIKAYEEAKKHNYRFFSFGDCMLIS
ncbi:MAG: tRNA preQ1(34) S-adenosylmethionine ribosyltransferase-isomerase QueA [Actinobacteria bacterium]|nr:tRNA preQ1(34) S-adenosylmethionine ribosyltransferase-isomerase QueA [Actinomycetota bacterium]MCL5072600.1 tRNA preQ1(34) S-adenosylmethionine ribosyltransferase-isomerase QueA [Actinomycetota bacterium]